MSTSIGELEGTISLEDQFSDALHLVAHNAEKVFGEMEGFLGTVAIAATAVVTAITGIAGTIAYLGVQGSHLNDLDAGFEKLAGSEQKAADILEAMNKGVADTIDSTKLLSFANRALSTGAIKTAQDFGTVTSAARVLARQGLGEVESNMQAISSAMATGRVKQLQYLVGAIDLKKAEIDYAKSIGTTADQLSQAGKVHAAQIAIIDRLNQKVTQAGDLQKSFAEKVTTARLAIANWFDDIAKAVAKSPAVSNAFDAIGASLVKNFGGGAKTVQETIINWIERFANAAAYYGPIVIDWLKKTFDWITDVWHRVQAAWDTVPDWFKKIALEAGAMALAVKLAKGALDGIVMGGGGGGSVLGDVASGATIVSGLQSVISLAPTVGRYFKTVGEAASVAGMAVKLAWGAEGATGALLVVRDLLGGMALEGTAQLLAFLGPVGLAAVGVTALGFALYELKKRIDAAGKGLDDLSKHKNADNYINGLKDSAGQLIIHLDEAKQKLDALGGGKNPLLFQGKGLEAHMPGEGPAAAVPPPSEIKDMSKEITAATKLAIDRTTALWEQYYALADKDATDAAGVQTRANQRWFDDLKAKLDEGKKLNKNYYNELLALQSVFEAKATDIIERETMRQLKIRTDAFAKAVEEAFQFPEGAPLQMKPLNIPINVPDIATPMAEAERAITKAMNAAAKSVLPVSAAIKDMVKQLNAAGYSAEQIAEKLNLPVRSVENLIGKTSHLSDTLGGLSEAFSQLAQISDGSLGKVLQTTGQLIAATNIAVKAYDSLNASIKAGTATFADYAAAFSSWISLVITGAQILSDWLSKDAKLAQELFEFKASENTTAVFNALTESVMGYSKALIDAVMNAKTLQEAQAAFQKVQDALSMANEAASKYGPSTGDLITQYQKAKELYDFMVKSGVYTAQQLEQAWKDVEEAANRAAGLGQQKGAPRDPVVDAATRAAQEMADQAEAAGYRTREELQKAADKAEKLYEFMRDSGKYTAEQIEDAFKKAQEAMDTAYGINTEAMKKMKAEYESLQKAVEAEAPEAAMGVIETQQRARMDQLKKEMEAEQAKLETQRAAASHKEAEANGKTLADTFAKTLSAGIIDPFGPDFDAHLTSASSNVSSEFAGTSSKIQADFGNKSQEAANTVTKNFGNSATQVGKDFAASAVVASSAIKDTFANTTVNVPVVFDYKTVDTGEFEGAAGKIADTFSNSASKMRDEFKSKATEAAANVVDAFKNVEIRIPIRFDDPEMPSLGGDGSSRTLLNAPANPTPTHQFPRPSVPIFLDYEEPKAPNLPDLSSTVSLSYGLLEEPRLPELASTIQLAYGVPRPPPLPELASTVGLSYGEPSPPTLPDLRSTVTLAYDVASPPTLEPLTTAVHFAYDAVELPKVDDVVTPVHFDYDAVALPKFEDVTVPVHYAYDKVMLPDFGEVTVAVHYRYDPIEQPEGQDPKKMAAGTGGIAFASGPMTFSTKGNEYYAFGGEGKGLAGLFAGPEESTPPAAAAPKGPTPVTLRIDKLQIGKNIALKDIVISDLADSPNTKDIQVISGLVRAGKR